MATLRDNQDVCLPVLGGIMCFEFFFDLHMRHRPGRGGIFAASSVVSFLDLVW